MLHEYYLGTMILVGLLQGLCSEGRATHVIWHLVQAWSVVHSLVDPNMRDWKEPDMV